MLIKATETEYKRSSIVAVNWNAMGSYCISSQSNSIVNFDEFNDHPMLFIDVFEEPAKAKIVDPVRKEIRYVEIDKFSPQQSIKLSKIIRRNYSTSSLFEQGSSPSYYKEMKIQAGF